MTILTLGGKPLVISPVTSYSVAETTATLTSGQTVRKFTPTPNDGKAGVLLFPGAYNTCDQWNTDASMHAIALAVAGAGFPCLAISMGRQVIDEDGLPDTLWGADASTATGGYCDEADTYLTSNMGADTSSRILVAISGGGADAIVWASKHLSRVDGFLGIAPATDIKQLHDTNPLMPIANIAASIEDVGGTGSALASWYQTHSPLEVARAGKLRSSTSGSLRYKVYYGTSDTVITPTSITTMLGFIGDSVGVPKATDHFGIAAQVPPSEVAKFVVSCYAPTAATTHILSIP